MRLVDLRSDTITQPTSAMRRAMAEAPVGDDVFGEDPTVNRLEAMAAERLGKEAALFVTSGTMGNLVSLLAHCNRGDEVILGDQSHTFLYEQGGAAALGGIHPRTLSNQPNGSLAPEDIEAAIRPDNIHFPPTRLIALENTHNRCFGNPIDAAYMQTVAEIAKRRHIKIHVDGARLFNAAVALNTEPYHLVAAADSVSFCLSKGLAAPAGSLVCGSNQFIAKARRARKILGGGMRQSGILAAAGIVALTEMTKRLSDDHANAAALAKGLSRIEGLSIDTANVRTNLVFFDCTRNDLSAAVLSEQLNERGVRVLPTGPKRLRAVTHYQVNQDDIAHALDVIHDLLS